MTTIVLCGKKSDTGVAELLVNALGKYGEVQYYNGERLVSIKEKLHPKFCVFDCEKIPKLEVASGILLFKNSFDGERRELPGGFLPVFEAHNTQAAAALGGTGLNAVVCGTSSKDTLSLASITDTDATISLQRSIRSMSGEILEPYDIPIHLGRSSSPYPVLATCAVFLLAGIHSGEEYYF